MFLMIMNWSVFFRLVFQKKKTFCLKNALLKKERGLIRFPLIKDKFQFGELIKSL